MRSSRVICLVAVFLNWAATASAQVCLGAPAFNPARIHLGVLVDTNDEYKRIGGQVLVGRRDGGLFVGGAAGGQTEQGYEGTAVLLAGSVGLDLPLGAARRFYACPLFSVAFESGPDNPFADRSFWTFVGGGAAGFLFYERPGGLRMVLTGGVHGYRQTARTRYFDLDTSDSTGGSDATVGVGFAYRWVFLIPHLNVPIGGNSRGVRAALGLGFAF